VKWWRVWFGQDSVIMDGRDAWSAGFRASMYAWLATNEWHNVTKVEEYP
jgi:hypothetical protein